jgi:hypothetical protein
VSEPDC